MCDYLLLEHFQKIMKFDVKNDNNKHLFHTIQAKSYRFFYRS